MKNTNRALTIEQILHLERSYNYVHAQNPNFSISKKNNLPVVLLCALLNTGSPIPSIATSSISVPAVVVTTNSALQATTESDEFRRMVCRTRKNNKTQRIKSHDISEISENYSLRERDFITSPPISSDIVEEPVRRTRVRVRTFSKDVPVQATLESIAADSIDIDF